MKRTWIFPWKVFLRSTLLPILLAVVFFGVSGLAMRHFFKQHFIEQVEGQLRDTLVSLSDALIKTPDRAWCEKRAAGTSYRWTVVSKEGEVICDSHSDPSQMENHGARPEIREAWQTGFGQSLRESATLHLATLYQAHAVRDRSYVVRVALPMKRLGGMLQTFDRSLLIFLVAVSLMAAVTTLWSGSQMLGPLGRLLFRARELPGAGGTPAEEEHVYDEWSDLEDSIEGIRRSLEQNAEILSQERQRMSTLLESVTDAVLSVTRDELPLFFNQRFAAVFCSGMQAVYERKLWELFREPEILSTYRNVIQSGRPAELPSFAFGQSGERRYYSLSVSPLRDEKGRIYGALGIFRDVTELKRSEQMRIEFVANVSHELRTPLTAIKGYADTLLEDARESRPITPGFVEVIARNTDRLMRLVSDLLDLSALDSRSGSELVQKQRVDVREATNKVIQQLVPNLQKKNQTICLDAQVETVWADPVRLEQVLTNLLDNAHKYTPSGGRIHVIWKPDVELHVTDTGPGIPVEHQSRLFERFYRIDKARSREVGGTGLGLAIVKHIMQRHGGTVKVVSEVGKGADFVCYFPSESLTTAKT